MGKFKEQKRKKQRREKRKGLIAAAVLLLVLLLAGVLAVTLFRIRDVEVTGNSFYSA